MTQSLKFVTLDVFTSTPYTGNPLAVVFLENASAIKQQQKQLIAREFNFSETIFVHPGDGEKRTIDIFTKTVEIPFAGHPTIGAASWHLVHSTEEDRRVVRVLETKSGDIPISVHEAAEKVAARIAHNVRIHAKRFPLSELLRLHSSLKPFLQDGVDFPVVSIVNGMSQVHVELPSLDALGAVTTAAGGEVLAVDAGYQDAGWENGICVFYFFVRGVEDKETGEKVIRTRAVRGNLEDPATGSAASGLAAYLTLLDGKPGEYTYSIRQGVEMGRPSEIQLGVVVKQENVIDSVELKGAAVKVSEGSIIVPPVA